MEDKASRTQVVSVRLPSVAMRESLSARCESEGMTVSSFVTTVVQAFIDGRLRIVEPPPPVKPSFFVEEDIK